MSGPEVEIIAGRYRVLRELGRGGMGVVYLVEHVHTGDQLALKLLLNMVATPEAIERFKREARAPARIKSEHVVKVTDADISRELGAPFLVMECLDGCDLERRIELQGRLDVDEVLWIFRQLAVALDKAHAIGIVHRDLKPENIFMHRREDGAMIKLLDFGISKAATDGGDMASAGLTKSGAMMGTPLYMAPEQALGQTQRIAATTDVWALGLIAYRLLTGEVYWQAQTLAELMLKIVTDTMPAPSSLAPTLPAGFDAWFARSCAREAEQRWPSVGEQTAALALALGRTQTSQLAVSDVRQRLEQTLSKAPAYVPPTSALPFVGTTGVQRGVAVSQDVEVAKPRSGLKLVLAGVAGLAAIAGLATLLVTRTTNSSSTSASSSTNPPAFASAAAVAEPAPQLQPQPPASVAPSASAATSGSPAPSASTPVAALPKPAKSPRPELSKRQSPAPAAPAAVAPLPASPPATPPPSPAPAAPQTPKRFDPQAP